MERTHYVKGKRIGTKQYAFVSPTGLNRLRIHAVMYSKDDAEEVAIEMAKLNPGYEFKPVPMHLGK